MTSRADCPNCLDLEAAFGVCADQREPAPNARWEVIDAECETVAFCPSEALAGVVATALNAAAPGPAFALKVHCHQHPPSVDPLSDTGRSPTPPALQNIPLRTALGRQLRDAFAFTSDPIGSVDYAAIERRIAEKFR